jgi:hypothetical protein
MRFETHRLPTAYNLPGFFLAFLSSALLLPVYYIANHKAHGEQIEVKKVGPEHILPAELYRSYSKLMEIVKDEEKWSQENALVSLSYGAKLRELLAKHDLTFEAYTKLPSDCHLVRTKEMDLYFVRTKAEKYFLYKAVPR